MKYYLLSVTNATCRIGDNNFETAPTVDMFRAAKSVWVLSSNLALSNDAILLHAYLSASKDEAFTVEGSFELDSMTKGELTSKDLLDISLNGGADQIFMYCEHNESLIRKIYNVQEISKENFDLLNSLNVPEFCIQLDDRP